MRKDFYFRQSDPFAFHILLRLKLAINLHIASRSLIESTTFQKTIKKTPRYKKKVIHTVANSDADVIRLWAYKTRHGKIVIQDIGTNASIKKLFKLI